MSCVFAFLLFIDFFFQLDELNSKKIGSLKELKNKVMESNMNKLQKLKILLLLLRKYRFEILTISKL